MRRLRLLGHTGGVVRRSALLRGVGAAQASLALRRAASLLRQSGRRCEAAGRPRPSQPVAPRRRAAPCCRRRRRHRPQLVRLPRARSCLPSAGCGGVARPLACRAVADLHAAQRPPRLRRVRAPGAYGAWCGVSVEPRRLHGSRGACPGPLASATEASCLHGYRRKGASRRRFQTPLRAVTPRVCSHLECVHTSRCVRLSHLQVRALGGRADRPRPLHPRSAAAAPLHHRARPL